MKNLTPSLLRCFFGLAFSLMLCIHKAEGQSISGVVNTYHKVTVVDASANTLTVDDAGTLSSGAKVMIIQMKGASMATTNNSSFGDIASINGAGLYEFNYICSVSGNLITLTQSFLNTYDPSQYVQLVSVPVYSDVTVTGTLQSVPWDAATGKGGVIAIEAGTSITLNANIDASGAGFKGGGYRNFAGPTYQCSNFAAVTNYSYQSSDFPGFAGMVSAARKGEGIVAFNTLYEYGKGKNANGGGGGNNHNAGGGGGSNYGIGGRGGNNNGFSCSALHPGLGGLSLLTNGYTSSSPRIFLGGGGGAGHGNNNYGISGGNGGGIIYLRTPALYANGYTISANGIQGSGNGSISDPTIADGDGGGGGGGGGVILFDVDAVSSGSVNLQVKGGVGSNTFSPVSNCAGPGGGGGGGVVWYKQSTDPSNTTTDVNGGSNGIVLSSALGACVNSALNSTSGTNGIKTYTYSAPISLANSCTVLPLPVMREFRVSNERSEVRLSWNVSDYRDVVMFEVERSVDQVNFVTVSTLKASRELNYRASDQVDIGSYYYRLKIWMKDGAYQYSDIRIIHYKLQSGNTELTIRPNPVTVNLMADYLSELNDRALLSIYDVSGRRWRQMEINVTQGLNRINIPAKALPAGTYFLSIRTVRGNITRTFIRQ